MPRYKLTVAYDGTDFHGWQKQCARDGRRSPGAAETDPTDGGPLRTVQGVLEEAAGSVAREPVDVLGASRTDTGVHAVGQVAAFTCGRTFEPDRLWAALNARLPDDVRVRRVHLVEEGFCPVTEAIAKGYRFRIAHSSGLASTRPLFGRSTTFWTARNLDPVRMNEAARHLMGVHDFASFTRLHHSRRSTVRTVYNCLVAATGRHRLRIEISGDGFLHNMVRIIAGTLVDVGRGKIEPEAIDDIIAATDRRAAGPTLPPQGLCLMWVKLSRAGPACESCTSQPV